MILSCDGQEVRLEVDRTAVADLSPLAALAADDPPGHALMLAQVIRFFQTGESPVDAQETLEVMAFLDAAEQSLRLEGEPVELPR